MAQEWWVNVYAGIYGSGELHYSPRFKTRDAAQKQFFPVGVLVYRVHVCLKAPLVWSAAR